MVRPSNVWKKMKESIVCLGTLECETIKNREMKNAVKTEYFWRIKK